MGWRFDGTAPTFDAGALGGYTFDGAGGAVAPVVTLNPSNQTIGNGHSASFTAAASGVPPPTVQWQTDSGTSGATWTNVPGATSDTYVTGPLGLGNSGWQYRAVFTNGSGSAVTSAARVTVISIVYSGGSMEFVFGPGNMIVTPLTDAYGNVIANPSPRRMGGFQEASFDSSAENKMLYGPNQYPIAVGRGKGKTGINVKSAQFSVDQWNAMFIGQPTNQTASVISAYIDGQGTVIPGTPFTITPVTTYAAFLTAGTSPAFDYDLGVQDGNGNTYTRVASGPTTGQYSLSGGVYTFATADAGKTVFISFAYTATNATGAKNAYVNVANIQMGQAPFLQLDLFCTYGGNPLLVTLYQAVAGKLSFATKLDDFAIPNMEFDGFANGANQVYRIAGAQ